MSSSDEQQRSTKLRRYQMRKRKDDVDGTRQRIVEASVHLHGTVGPAHTTVSAIAERARVQRSTVYRHFPDDEALFGACTRHWLSQHPWPDPHRWAETSDPARRCAEALGELYAYYDVNRNMLRNSYRDRDIMPPFVTAARLARLEEMRRVLAKGWRVQGRRRSRLEAAIVHALDLRTSESLADTGLSPQEAAWLMADLVCCAAATGTK